MANNFQVANIAGQFQAGQQAELGRQAQAQQAQQSQFAATQAQELAPVQLQQAQANLLGTQQQNQEQEEAAVFSRNVNSALELQSIPDDQKVAFLDKKIAANPNKDMSHSIKARELILGGRLGELKTGTQELLNVAVRRNVIAAAPVAKLSSLQQKVAAEGLDPNTEEGQARAREITQGSRTDPTLARSDQEVLNKANEGQLASASFANRVLSANENLTLLEKKTDFDPTSIQTAFFEAIPGGNLVLSEDEQSYAQSKRDFITAILRKESGAAIGKDEFANEDKKFFPQVGDKAAVLKQKAAGRKRTFENLKNQSKGVFDVQAKQNVSTGELSAAEKTELQQLRAELGQ